MPLEKGSEEVVGDQTRNSSLYVKAREMDFEGKIRFTKA